MRSGRDIDLAGLEPGDDRFVAPGEVVFLMLRGRDGRVELRSSPEEVFARNEVRLRPVAFRPTDYLGHACLHCQRPVEDPADMVVSLRNLQVVAVLHESCFKRWFVLQDKAGLGSYRFGLLQTARLASTDGVTRILLVGRETIPELHHDFDALEEIEYSAILEPGADAEPAYVRGQGRESGTAETSGKAAPTDTNLVFCPRCDHPNKVAFLEMVGTAHACERCQGRYAVKVIEI